MKTNGNKKKMFNAYMYNVSVPIFYLECMLLCCCQLKNGEKTSVVDRQIFRSMDDQEAGIEAEKISKEKIQTESGKVKTKIVLLNVHNDVALCVWVKFLKLVSLILGGVGAS